MDKIKSIDTANIIGNMQVDNVVEARKEGAIYDYKTIETDCKEVLEIIDCNETLGWEAVNKSQNYITNKVTISFRRSRKIKNKELINRVQVKLDDAFECIKDFEKRKTKKATIISICLGIIGALIFGGGMSLCMFLPLEAIISYVVGISLGAIGAIVCVLAYPMYNKAKNKDTMAMDILIEKKRHEISELCDEGHKLLS